jgi:hypothetical protein
MSAIKRYLIRLTHYAALLAAATGYTQTDSTLTRIDSLLAENSVIMSAAGSVESEPEVEQQEVSSLLLSSGDVFLQHATFQFGAARYRPRGYSGTWNNVLVNGVNMNDPESGFASWSSWGGLNDVMSNAEVRFGLTSNRYGCSGPAGYTNIDSRASSMKKRTKYSYALANRAFSHRVSLMHATGLLRNGWAFAGALSARYGNNTYVAGTSFNSLSLYLSVDKRITEKQMLSFTGYFAPGSRGLSSAEPLSAYKLSGDNYYNSQWGYQNGEIRNASVKTMSRPVAMVSYINELNPHALIKLTAHYTFGRSASTALNWNDASNPKPDYYRNMPDYYYAIGDSTAGNSVLDSWMNDPASRQLSWDRFYELNRNNLYAGPGTNSPVTGVTRARYILENRIEDLSQGGLNFVVNRRIGSSFLSGGFNSFMYVNRKYKEMEDLLGATYWLDYDQFAPQSGTDDFRKQNDIEHPDRQIHKGERFGYDYSIKINRAECWGQAEHSFGNADVYLSGNLAQTRIIREGFIANGKFPVSSKGKSAAFDFTTLGIKGGSVFKISGRNFITLNSAFITRVPDAANLFISPRSRNDLVTDVKPEKIMSADISYEARYPAFRCRFTLYHSSVTDQVKVRSYWHESYNNNVNMVMKGIDQSFSGIELGIEKSIAVSHILQLSAGLGNFIYTSRPTLDLWQDNDNLPLYQGRTSFMQNYHVGGTPSAVAAFGYRYEAKQHWYLGCNLNFLARSFVDPNPDRRTAEALEKYISTELAQFRNVIEQEELPAYYIVNLSGGKSWRLAGKYYLNASLSVNNLLNRKDFVSYGSESLRWDPSDISKFSSKYLFYPGTTFLINLSFSF